MRTYITQDPFLHQNLEKVWHVRGWWPAHWITYPNATPPFVAAFRRYFRLEESTTIRIHVTADERYQLFLNGEQLGRGPERGAPDRWYYESYDLALSPGKHLLVARVWALGEQAPYAQMSVQPGFLLAAQNPDTQEDIATLLNTGIASWETTLLDSYTFINPPFARWKGANVEIDGASFPWGFQEPSPILEKNDQKHSWLSPAILKPGIGKHIWWEKHPEHILHPATLPTMLEKPTRTGTIRYVGEALTPPGTGACIQETDSLPDEIISWAKLLNGEKSLIVPPHTQRRAIIDLENYLCAYSTITTSNGKDSQIRVHWAESLYESPEQVAKGNRDIIEGKYFFGQGDTFLPDGGTTRQFEPLWWSAGRYIEVTIRTKEQPLIIENFSLNETRYPLEMESSFDANEPCLKAITPLLIRGLQMCAHETYFDCPYYEELQYGGDMRLEALVNYVMNRDELLARKALDIFDSSRLASGMTQSRYPSRVIQIIPSWSLWWVIMVRDYAYWRCDLDFVKGLMPGVRATMEGFQRYIGSDGLLHAPEGWNIFDWVPTWEHDSGCPPDAVSGVSGVLNWHLIYTLVQYADLEEHLNEPLLAERAYRQATRLTKRAINAFWNEERGLLADDHSHQHFSEHTQCLALLSNMLERPQRARVAEGLLTAPDLDRMTVYASHYLFETFRKLRCVERMFERLSPWFDMVENGLQTGLEKPEPSRSDCHGWSSHPLYHYFATILGIRPSDVGFCSIEIMPQLGHLTQASGRLVHPKGGEIAIELHRDKNMIHGKLSLPPDMDAMLHVNGQSIFFREETKEF